MRALIHVGDPQRFHEVNEAFHGAIYAGAHNAYLAEMTLATRARVQPFRRAQFRTLGRLAKSHVEHDRVVIAILRGERERAGERDARPHRHRARGLRGLRRLAVGRGLAPRRSPAHALGGHDEQPKPALAWGVRLNRRRAPSMTGPKRIARRPLLRDRSSTRRVFFLEQLDRRLRARIAHQHQGFRPPARLFPNSDRRHARTLASH